MKKTNSVDPEIVVVLKKRAEKALERFRTKPFLVSPTLNYSRFWEKLLVIGKTGADRP